MIKTPIRVVVADDHAVVRAGICALLKGLSAIEVMGQATNGREALKLVKLHSPQILLTDISMPEMNGLEATVRVIKDDPSVRVIVVSMHTSEEYVWKALQAGATGYLMKDTDSTELETAIKTVVNGETYLTPAVSKQALENYMQRMGNGATISKVLTPRQREILQLIAEGNALKEIAKLLHISVKTVETHRMLLMERLDIHDTPGLVRYAMRMGIITREE